MFLDVHTTFCVE